MKKKWYYIGGGVALLIVLIFTFGFFSQTAFLMERTFGLQSDFTALIGTKVALNEIVDTCELQPTDDEEEVCIINAVMKNIYGYAIFDGPAKMNKESRNSIVSSMTEMNNEVKRPDEYKQFTRDQKRTWDKTFGKGIFSSTLITTVKKTSYSYTDLQRMATELDKSLNVWCNGLSTVFLSGKFDQFYQAPQDNSEVDMWLQICEKKPDKIFVITKETITVNMPNIDLYRYNRYKTICEDADNPCSEGTLCQIKTCRVEELPETEKKYIGTLYFNELDVQIRKLGNDFIFGVNEGITDSGKFTRELDFSKYILQMPWQQGIDITTDRDFPSSKPGFAVVSTNEKITKIIDDVIDLRESS